MESLVSLLKQALWIEKRITFGSCTMKESSQSPFYHSAWHQATKTTSHMLYLEDTTPLRSFSEKLVFRLSITTQHLEPLKLGPGLLMPRTCSMTANPCSTASKQRAFRLSSIPAAPSWQFLQRSMLLFRTCGKKTSKVSTAILMLPSVNPSKVVTKLRKW
jgi:hypothetical protein